MKRQGTHRIHGRIGGELVPAIVVVEPGDSILVADPEAAGGVEVEVDGMLDVICAPGGPGVTR